jgi:mRNA interferase MazF
VAVGRANGLQHDSVVSCDNVTTIPTSAIGRLLGYLHASQEAALSRAIASAYDLDM